jgi:hypothetical protein
MTSRSPIMGKTSTLLDETIHIMPGCTVHLHDHRNKVTPLMKLSILVDLSNGAKFHNYTCQLTMHVSWKIKNFIYTSQVSLCCTLDM